MSGYGIPFTPYHTPSLDIRKFTKDDVANIVATHLVYEGLNLAAYEIGVRHTYPRMAAHHQGSMAAARAQTSRGSMIRGIQLVATHVPAPVYIVAATIAVAMGYGATSDVHHGAVPGVTGFGGVGPGYYSSSDPMGQFRSGVEGLAFWR